MAFDSEDCYVKLTIKKKGGATHDMTSVFTWNYSFCYFWESWSNSVASQNGMR